MSLHIGRDLSADVLRTPDVCIIGSGAGGAVLAAGLVEAGLDVVMLEEGGHYTKADFDMQESKAFPNLYQDRGTRASADLAVTILQGRSVGGSTTVNWTTCFRTPERILALWRQRFGLEGMTEAALLPHFEAVEARLNIQVWPEAKANSNNQALARGCEALGWEYSSLRRNVKGCVNSGYCGMGCPVDGKQAMGITYVQDALAGGMELFADTRATRLVFSNKGGQRRVNVVEANVLDRRTGRATGVRVQVRPKVVVASGGAINTPVLLLRSGLSGLPVGLRTFLHPVVAVTGLHEQPVHGFYGAPQSISSHQFIDRGADKLGFFLEATPVHPMLIANSSLIFGAEHNEFMGKLAHMSTVIALTVDGVHPQDQGATVSLRRDGRPRVDVPLGPLYQESFRAAHQAMVQASFAGGAQQVFTTHRQPLRLDGIEQLGVLDTATFGAHEHGIFTAHQMGGCTMGTDPDTTVVDPEHRVRGVDNLFVVDGSVLPTALGVNPSETIYGLAHRARGFVAAAV